MPIVPAATGKESLLDIRLNENWPAGGKDLFLRLYTNTISLVYDLETSDFTEASGGDYVAKTLACGNWEVNAGKVPATAVYLTRYFVFTGAIDGSVSVKGFYVTDADGVLQWMEEFSSPITPTTGTIIPVVPKFQFSLGNKHYTGARGFLNARFNDVWPASGHHVIGCLLVGRITSIPEDFNIYDLPSGYSRSNLSGWDYSLDTWVISSLTTESSAESSDTAEIQMFSDDYDEVIGVVIADCDGNVISVIEQSTSIILLTDDLVTIQFHRIDIANEDPYTGD